MILVLAAKSDGGDIAQVVFFVLFVIISGLVSWAKSRAERRKREEAARRRYAAPAEAEPAPPATPFGEEEAEEEDPEPAPAPRSRPYRGVDDWVRRERERLRGRRPRERQPERAPAPVFEEVPEPAAALSAGAFVHAHPEAPPAAAFVDPSAVARRPGPGSSASPRAVDAASRSAPPGAILPPAVDGHLSPAQRAIAYALVIGPCAARSGPPHRQAQRLAPPSRPRRPRAGRPAAPPPGPGPGSEAPPASPPPGQA